MTSRNDSPSSTSPRRRGGAAAVAAGAAATLCLAVALIGSGLFVCSAPFATDLLSSAFSRSEGSPFTHGELVRAAAATRDYTVGSHSRDDVLRVVYDINRSAADDGRATLRGAPDLPESDGEPDTDELAARFMLADDTYVLTDDALSHLDDVYLVVSTARIAFAVSAALGLACCVIVGVIGGRRHLGRTLIAASLLVVAVFASLAIWAMVDFNGFFTFLHSLFFTEGTWTFSADSLLIRMYPSGFWIGMGAFWLITTVVACIICFMTGLLTKGRKRPS